MGCATAGGIATPTQRSSPPQGPPSASAIPAIASPATASASAQVHSAAYPTPGHLVPARFVRIVDGDTIKVEWKGAVVSVRYIGMDTPETVKPGTPVAWMGPEASAANQKLLDRSGGTVYLEKDVSETDRYGRLLRYGWIKADGAWLMVNLELLRLGVAQVATFPPDVKYIDPWFLDAQAAARATAIGLWGATPRPAASPGTVAVAVCGGNKDAPGDDNLNLNGEYVVICNRGNAAAALGGWSLTDDGARHTYHFGAFTLRAAGSVTLYSGAGKNSATALYWNNDGAIWNNDGDCAHLYSAQGALVSSRCL